MLFTRQIVLLALVTAPAVAGNLQIDWFTIDCGGGQSSGGELSLVGTLGQPDAGVMTGGSFELVGGFWGVAAPGVPAAPGDCDADGDVDLDDYADVPGCLDGPGGGLSGPECDCFDFDADSDVDLLDFAEFQVVFTG